MTNHLWLDLNGVEFLSGVDTNDGTDHLWDDDHVTEVSLDGVWLLVWLGLLLRLAKLLDQTHWLALQTTVEPAAGTGVDDIAELLGRKVQEPRRYERPVRVCGFQKNSLVKVDSTVRELSERSLGLKSCTSVLAHVPTSSTP